MLEFMGISCAVPGVKVADVQKNLQDICDYIAKADAAGSDLVLFPELALTGYSCADLFFQETLLQAARDALGEIARCTGQYPRLVAVVGLPLKLQGQMYNCAAVLAGGRVLGIVPKTYLPNYHEFYERRWFSSAEDLHLQELPAAHLGLAQQEPVPVGRNLLFRAGDGVLIGVEICEDLWTLLPPSTLMCLNGAEVIVNLSASNETVGKRVYRRDLVRHQSAMCSCVYAYASAGFTESTQDLVFSGHSIVAVNGAVAAENQNQIDSEYLLTMDVDLGQVRSARKKNKSVKDAAALYGPVEPMRVLPCGTGPLRSTGNRLCLRKLPFVPRKREDQQARCREIFNIQAAGLKQRLALLNAKAVVGVSGGLDSTLALLVAVEAMRQLGRPSSEVIGVTMPCFGTTGRTHANALALMEKLGITAKEIDICSAVQQHFADLGYPDDRRDATYENAQARERTQVLMDYAGMVGGIVVGTGDLSELALGWCTYNGDQMSMYGVNASVPKTLLRWMVGTLARDPDFSAVKDILLDVWATPISPELLPPDASGNIAQITEDVVGPYELHDFFLYYMLRYDYAPEKIYCLACRAFAGDYNSAAVKKWLKVFYRRFFTQQFKRNSLPDGVKVGSVSLNPRGDWRMPSDAAGRLWLEAVDKL